MEQPALGIAAGETVSRGLPPDEIIFLCRRPAPGAQATPEAQGDNFVPAFGR